jgi:ATP diphosphatase
VSVQRLLEIMARLRDPQRGCPWDLAQTWESIAPHTIEEAYEVAEAVVNGDPAMVRDELGDLLFQVVFQARIAQERGLFDFDAVAEGICGKLLRRHPPKSRPSPGRSTSAASASSEAAGRVPSTV